MKNLSAKILNRLSNTMIVSSSASMCSWGVEKMPKSMIKNR